MVKDGIVLKNGKTQLALHQHSFCELVKYLLVGISYEEASQRVEQSPLAVPVTDAAEVRLFRTPESKARQWMGSQIFHLSHAGDVDRAWAASRTAKELAVVENHVRAEKQYDTWTDEDETGYQIYL